MFEAKGIWVDLDGRPVVRGVSLIVGSAEIVALVGPNGAGKSTLGRALAGLVHMSAGSLETTVASVTTKIGPLPAAELYQRGVQYVPSERPVFEALSVLDNLVFAGASRVHGRAKARKHMDATLALFPLLIKTLGRRAGVLSGGEKRLVALARAYIAIQISLDARGAESIEPLLILDEPSQGLAPVTQADVKDAILGLRKAGTSILVIEQNVAFAAAVASTGYRMSAGDIWPIDLRLVDDSRARSRHPL